MTRHDSDSALAGKMAAQLTAPVVRTHAPRGEMSSGLFDLDSLYERDVGRIEVRMPPALPLMARPPAAMRPSLPSVDELTINVDVEDLIPDVLRPKPIGWYAVFVTWVATSTLACLVATQVPAHALAPAPAPTQAVAPAPTQAVAPAMSASAPPVLSIADLPRVTAEPSRALQKPAPVAKHAFHAAAAPVHAAAAPVHAEPAAAPAPPPTPAPAAAPPAAPAPAAGSLEDLIRREVAAEQKKVHAGQK